MSQVIFNKIVELLEKEHANYEVLEHIPEGRCEEICKIRGHKLEEANKALVVRAKTSQGKKYFLLALRADQRADFEKVGQFSDIRLSDPAKVLELTDCELGSVPPFSFNENLKLVVDPLLLENEFFWFNAGLLTKSIHLKTEDYIRITKPEIKDISKRE
ncbi:MAG: YbaK/EbsC family protein [bacterium]